jgi:hypothetical protein
VRQIGQKAGSVEGRLMFVYFLLFMGVGLAVGHFVKEKKQALIVLVAIALLWGLSHRAIWGFVTLGELLLGYVVFGVFLGKKDQDTNDVSSNQ